MLYLRVSKTRLALKLFRGEPAISGFDWNFSPTHTLIATPFQRMCVRPSTASYGSFSLDMGRSPGFGSAAADVLALLRLGFPSAPDLKSLTSPAPATRRNRSTKSTRSRLRAPTACRHRVSGSLFTPPYPGSFSPFLHSTMRLSVTESYLALGGGPPCFPQGFPVSRGTLDPARLLAISPTGLSPSLAGFPKTVRLSLEVPSAVRNPKVAMHPGLGSSPFARRYLGNSMFLSLPPGT